MTELCVVWSFFPIVFSYKINKHHHHIQTAGSREWCLLDVREVENEIKKHCQLRIGRMPLQSLSNKTNNILSGDNCHSHHFINIFSFCMFYHQIFYWKQTIKII